MFDAGTRGVLGLLDHRIAPVSESLTWPVNSPSWGARAAAAICFVTPSAVGCGAVADTALIAGVAAIGAGRGGTPAGRSSDLFMRNATNSTLEAINASTTTDTRVHTTARRRPPNRPS